MAKRLTRKKFEKLGGSFSQEGVVYPSDPDQEIFAADLTIDGHTEHFQGKSEADVLDQARIVLVARGRIE